MSSVYPTHINGHVCLFSQYLPIIFRWFLALNFAKLQSLLWFLRRISAIFTILILICCLFILYDTVKRYRNLLLNLK